MTSPETADPAPLRPRFARADVVAFVLAVVMSAALLFTTEPMITRMLLPRFGGSASVWSVALVFFQGALLLGYLYAHGLIGWLGPRGSVIVHVLVLVAGTMFLPPVLPVLAAGGSPTIGVLASLAAVIGLPFVALSANAPLLQAWYASGEGKPRDPYPLYAASNAGSLVALLAYPFVIEPLAGLGLQLRVWSAGYLVLIVAIGLAALLGRPRRSIAVARGDEPVALAQWLFWACLALVPSAGLVAVTAHLSTNVAAAPFLWVIPLALYLTTFIFAFAGRAGRWLPAARVLMAIFVLVVAAVSGFNQNLGFLPDVALHLGAFFLIGLVFHGFLATRAPAPAHLTAFYLALSAGGLAGGLAAAIAAPALFSFIAEYPIVLLLAALTTPWRWSVGGMVAALLVLPGIIWPNARSIVSQRSFYGVHTVEVTPNGQFRTLRSGQEIHGAQRIADTFGKALVGKPLPLTYYSEDGPISEAIDAARVVAGGVAIRVGVVGLGAGSMACLVESRDSIDFFEIDPTVIAIAKDRANFTFLSDCGPTIRIIEGDARLTLAREKTRYDVLVIDAFSSDAIPVHLLTREAMDIYRDRLTEKGMLLLHISNNHLRLNEVVAATARSLGLAVRINDEYGPEPPPPLIFQATVAAIARKDADFGDLARSDEWPVPESQNGPQAWSDDHANLLAALIAKARED